MMNSGERRTLILFHASWAHRICEPYREIVHQVAEQLNLTVSELDIDDHPEAARRHIILNVPAVSLDVDSSRPIVGARTPANLTELLQDQLGG
jgi:hypothetical protein